MVSVIQKIGKYSFGRWLLCSQGLYRYLYPDNNELKTLAGVPKDKPKTYKKGGKGEQNGKAETFHVPRSLEIKLETALVSPLDVVHLRFYSEYQWIIDFSLYTSIVYILSEVRPNFIWNLLCMDFIDMLPVIVRKRGSGWWLDAKSGWSVMVVYKEGGLLHIYGSTN